MCKGNQQWPNCKAIFHRCQIKIIVDLLCTLSPVVLKKEKVVEAWTKGNKDEIDVNCGKVPEPCMLFYKFKIRACVWANFIIWPSSVFDCNLILTRIIKLVSQWWHWNIKGYSWFLNWSLSLATWKATLHSRLGQVLKITPTQPLLCCLQWYALDHSIIFV